MPIFKNLSRDNSKVIKGTLIEVEPTRSFFKENFPAKQLSLFLPKSQSYYWGLEILYMKQYKILQHIKSKYRRNTQ